MPEAENVSPKKPEIQPKTALAQSSVSGLVSWLVSILFYALIVIVILVVYLLDDQSGQTRVVFGHAAFTVLTGSMQPEIPQGSLVIVRTVDPNTINLGDDITFLRRNHRVVTHRVVEIIENYDESDMRGFRTKGTANPEPDIDVVYAGNVIGKVSWHSSELGLFLTWIRARVWFVVAFLAAFIALLAILRYLARTIPPKQLQSNESSKSDVSSKVDVSDET